MVEWFIEMVSQPQIANLNLKRIQIMELYAVKTNQSIRTNGSSTINQMNDIDLSNKNKATFSLKKIN